MVSSRKKLNQRKLPLINKTIRHFPVSGEVPFFYRGEGSRVMKKNFCRLPIFFLLFLLTGCMTEDEKLAAFFDRTLYAESINTPARFMSDRILAEETSGYIQDLSSPHPQRRREAKKQLSRLRDLILFGRAWEHSVLELNPSAVRKPPVIDGNPEKEEWKDTVEIRGSCLAGRRRKNFDGSRVLFKYDRDFLYAAAYFPVAENKNGKREVTGDDHTIFYFDTPGGSGWRYRECIVIPGKDHLNSFQDWTYCGNGKREAIQNPLTGTVSAASKIMPYGYCVELKIPRTMLRKDASGCCRIGIFRWDTSVQDYRTPLAVPYDGHDIFNRITLRLP